MAKAKVWLIRAGRKDEAKPLFLTKNVIAMGPGAIGDLSKVDKTRDAFKDCYRIALPEALPKSVGGAAGQLFRLCHEAKTGDYVLYPSKDGNLHVGTITGTYRFSDDFDQRYPHRRKVAWIRTASRGECSRELINEARAFKTFYEIAKCADEVRRLSGA